MDPSMCSVPRGSTVAVTGASGFIGSHVVEACLGAGYAVRCCVRDPSDASKTAHLRALGEASGAPPVSFARGDLGEAGSFDDAFEGCAAVVHVAAVVEINAVSDPMKEIVNPSTEGCRNVLASVRKHRQSVVKFVHTSSCIAVAAVADKKAPGASYDEEDFNEWSTVERDPYGFAKAAAETLVVKTCAEMDLPLATVNPGVTLGPCFTKAHTKSSTVLLRELLYGNKMLNYNCCFVDVRDVARAHAACLLTAATGRHLCVNDEGVMNTMDLGPVAAKACPQWKTSATPMYSTSLKAWMRTVHDAPLVGPAITSLFGITDFKLRVVEEKIAFSNAKAKAALGLTFTPLATTVRDGLTSLVEGGWVKPKPAPS